MLLDVVESMLGHVGHSQVGVLPHSALWGLQLSGEQLDHGGLAGSVGSNDSHAGVEGDSDADALKDLAGCVGVSARQQEDDCEMVRAVRGQEDEREKGEKGGGGGGGACTDMSRDHSVSQTLECSTQEICHVKHTNDPVE